MKHKNKLLLTAAAFTIIGGSVLVTNQVSAQTALTEQHPMSSLVQKLADKFGLNKDEVQAVFDQSREDMKAKMQADHEVRLSQLVTDGKITEAQKQLIIAKNKELEAKMQSEMESLKAMTDDQRKAAMQAHHEELKAWAQQNGIDMQYLMFKMHFKGHGGRGMKGDKVFFNQPLE